MFRNGRIKDTVLAIGVVGIILLIIIPLTPELMSVFLVINLAFSITILLITLFTKEPMEFSVFPSLLLICTLFRLALNVSSTRLILGNGGDAGAVIKTFGSFVVKGNLVVGFVVFLIIVVIQFLVITKGSERIAEVSARFTLDSLPGKQMAIDADMNAGIINVKEAKERRDILRRETDFYGAMDGASKFVKGDAIVAIIITIINALGGIIIGLVSGGMSFSNVIEVYILATIGDGLSSQLSALMISIGSGIIVTRAISEGGLGSELSKQIFNEPIVIMISSVVLIAMALIPGFPKLILFIIGGILFFAGYTIKKLQDNKPVEIVPKARPMSQIDHFKNPDTVYETLGVEQLKMEFGYSLIPIIDTSQGGIFLDRVAMIRRQCAMDLGIVVSAVRLNDNMNLMPNEYAIYIRDELIAKGEVLPKHILVMDYEAKDMFENIIEVKDPIFNMDAFWVSEKEKDNVEVEGYTGVDATTVIATHFHEIVKKHAYEMLSRQDVKKIIDNITKKYPDLVESIIPAQITLAQLQKVLSGLLKEGISIRDMITILETISDYASITNNTEVLIEHTRASLKRTITRQFTQGLNELRVITVAPKIEEQIVSNIQQNEFANQLIMQPEDIRSIINSLKEQVKKSTSLGVMPIVLVSPAIRLHFSKIAEQLMTDIKVLSYNELNNNVSIKTVGVVN